MWTLCRAISPILNDPNALVCNAPIWARLEVIFVAMIVRFSKGLALHLALAFALLSGLSISVAKGEEGMWLPLWLQKYNEADMQAKGLKLSAKDLYDINNASLKDAVLQFNGGCTAEIIGRNGLILTNHHCGFGQIQYHSKVGRNLIEDGFWAKSMAEELPNPDLSVSRLVRMEDISLQVIAAIGTATGEERGKRAAAAIADLAKAATEGTHFEAFGRSFFYGSEYYLFVMETFTDVRLVGAPSNGIGSFGGDTDNWVWPRHTGDFSLFRIYTGPDNKPAAYSQNNKPYAPIKFLSLNLQGPKLGDFTMVYGFPGRTQEYLPSWGIESVQRYSNPYKIRLRTKRLQVLDSFMVPDEGTRIQYAAKRASIANAWKKWQGENKGLKKLGVLAKKRRLEDTLSRWIAATDSLKAKYGKVLPRLEAAYADLNDLILPIEYMRESVYAIELLALAAGLEPVKKAVAEGKDPSLAIDAFEKGLPGFYKNYNARVDEALARQMFDRYFSDIQIKYLPKGLAEYKNAYGGGIHDFRIVNDLYDRSLLTSEAASRTFLAKLRTDPKKALKREPAFSIQQQFYTPYNDLNLPKYIKAQREIDDQLRLWIAAQREFASTKKFYPDANSTLRVAYGKIDSYKPMDGVEFTPFTTADGILAKLDTTVAEFTAPAKQVRLLRKKQYGSYANGDGKLPIAFIASNHTTGGNSGSPVLNGNGHLIGTNYDRCWEGTMSDLAYDPSICRNIALDIRYTLWTIDVLGEANWLLAEMDLVR